MSLSKEIGVVSSSTSGFPSVARGSVFSSVLQPNDHGSTWNEQLQMNWKFHKASDRLVFCKDRVQRLYGARAGLAERQNLLKAKIRHAAAAQVKAECVMESCLYPIFPEITR